MNPAPWGGRHVALRAVATLTGLLALSAVLSVVPMPSTSDERVVEARDPEGVTEPPNRPEQVRLVLVLVAHSQAVAHVLRSAALYEVERRRAAAVAPVRRVARSRPAAPVPAPRPAGACWGWLGLVSAHFPPAAVGTACAVLGCESRGDPNADNRRSTANGLFQVLGGPFDPAANVALAASMWRSRGWQPWDESRGCWN